MSIITWSDSLSVGIVEIDAQHKKLVSIINALNDNLLDSRSKSVFEQLLNELVSYTQEHFGTEEKLFAQFDYPETDDHKKEHKFFVQELMKFTRGFYEGGTEFLLSADIVAFLVNWLVNHIQTTDKKYSFFFKEKGLK